MPTPVLILDDSSKRTTLQNAWAQAKAAAQNIVTLYDATGLDALTPSEFTQLFTDFDNLIFDKITGGSLSIGSVPVEKSEALKLIAKPNGYDALVTAINQFAQDGLNKKYSYDALLQVGFDKNNISFYFVLDGSNTVQYATGLDTQLNSTGKYYATTDKQIAMFDFAQDVVAAFYTRGLDAIFGTGDTAYNVVVDVLNRSMDRIDSSTGTLVAKRTLVNE